MKKIKFPSIKPDEYLKLEVNRSRTKVFDQYNEYVVFSLKKQKVMGVDFPSGYRVGVAFNKYRKDMAGTEIYFKGNVINKHLRALTIKKLKDNS